MKLTCAPYLTLFVLAIVCSVTQARARPDNPNILSGDECRFPCIESSDCPCENYDCYNGMCEAADSVDKKREEFFKRILEKIKG